LKIAAALNLDKKELLTAALKETGNFSNVSKQAMMIRLQDLGLVHNETQARMTWAESYAPLDPLLNISLPFLFYKIEHVNP